MLVDRIEGKVVLPARNVVFQPALVVGESCSPLISNSLAGSEPR
jgi:LacI family transcriptional regulator